MRLRSAGRSLNCILGGVVIFGAEGDDSCRESERIAEAVWGASWLLLNKAVRGEMRRQSSHLGACSSRSVYARRLLGKWRQGSRMVGVADRSAIRSPECKSMNERVM